MGGEDEKENLVYLTIKNHAFAHWLLFKINNLLEDKIAYKMLLGKTKEAEKLMVQLALEAYTVEQRRENWERNNPSFKEEIVQKRNNTRWKKYKGQFFSSEGLQNIKNLCNSGSQMSDSTINKRKLSQKLFNESLSPKERSLLYGRSGSQNHFFGKRRPRELAGNFGKSKGVYILISPENERKQFSSLEEAMNYGLDEGVLKRNRNTNIPIKKGKWTGYLIEYKENKNYGKDYNKKDDAF